MRSLTEIIVHASATRPAWMAGSSIFAKMMEIKRWHVEDNGWSDIAYHFLIDRDGKVIEGRPLIRIGAHVLGRNIDTIGICLIGGHGSAKTDNFAEHFTAAQAKALRKQIADLRSQYPSIGLVTGHNQYAAKACPGFNVPAWYSENGIKPKAAKPSRVLRRGSRGDKVAEMIAGLHRLGYYTGELDDIFGPATERAVRNFQRAEGLKADGYAGPVTLKRLEARLKGATAAKPTPARASILARVVNWIVAALRG